MKSSRLKLTPTKHIDVKKTKTNQKTNIYIYTLEDISNLGRIRVTRKSKPVLLKSQLARTNIPFTQHGKLRWRPGIVSTTIVSVQLLGQLRRKIKLHCFCLSLSKRNKQRRKNME
jgi:hypothetical protein